MSVSLLTLLLWVHMVCWFRLTNWSESRGPGPWDLQLSTWCVHFQWSRSRLYARNQTESQTRRSPISLWGHGFAPPSDTCPASLSLLGECPLWGNLVVLQQSHPYSGCPTSMQDLLAQRHSCHFFRTESRPGQHGNLRSGHYQWALPVRGSAAFRASKRSHASFSKWE